MLTLITSILNEHQPLSDMQFERAVQTVTGVILRGIGLEPQFASLGCESRWRMLLNVHRFLSYWVRIILTFFT